MADSPPRQVPNWIGGFLQYTAGAPSPSIFRLWAALTTVSAALTRRVWTDAEQGKIYPNMETLLVGPSGVGKGPAIKPALKLLRAIDWTADSNPLLRSRGIRLGTDSTTAAGLFDEYMDEASVKLLKWGNQEVDFRSQVIVAEEAASFLHDVDLQMMSRIIKLLNCDEQVDERLRKDGERKVFERPVLAFLGGVQPRVLTEVFPDRAWDMGLTARTNFVFSEDKVRVPAFRKGTRPNPETFKALQADLITITNLSGPFLYTDGAAEFVDEWWLEKAEDDKPDHPRLTYYSNKRLEHLLRLCMVNAVARSNDLIVEEQDVELALRTMLDAEKAVGGMFSGIIAGNSNDLALADIAHQIENLVLTTGKPVPYHIVRGLVSKKVPVHYVDFAINQLKDQRLLKEIRPKDGKKLPGAGGNKFYIPAPKDHLEASHGKEE